MYSRDQVLQNQAYTSLLEAIDQPIESAYEVWDRLISDLKHKDNHVRSIAAQKYQKKFASLWQKMESAG